MKSQRAAGGGSAVWRELLNGLSREAPSGTEPVINQERMLVREKSGHLSI